MGRTLRTRVLLVEDEPLIRAVGIDALMDVGFEVTAARDADEAIKILEAAEAFDVLFTDIRMPGSMDGLALAKVVCQRWPAMKILITSGDTFPKGTQLPDDGHFLAKPYRLEALQNEISVLLH